MPLSAPIHELKRRAKFMARREGIPLHAALDHIARGEGFGAWSLLSARTSTQAPGGGILQQLSRGDMLLIGARPGHGKTRLAARLLLDAVRVGRRAIFYTFEYTETEAQELFKSLGADALNMLPEIVTSDEICADLVIHQLEGAQPGAIAIVDYLQILDQQRSKPPLADQLFALKTFARDSGAIFGFISQIDRAFDASLGQSPDLKDIRLPNPVPEGCFTKACFLHNGRTELQRVS